jgi:uncharacterized RDD family membrane protein YckC
VVGVLPLTFDILSVAVSTAIPGVAWALLFALAWRHPGFAESVGLGPRTFWLLLPGAILASFALLPVAPISGDVVAVSFAGAAFPLGVGLAGLGRVASPLRRWLTPFVVPLVGTTAVLLGVVLAADAGALAGPAHALHVGTWPLELGLVAAGVTVAFVLVLVASARNPTSAGRSLGAVFGLTGLVMLLTFAGATAIPGVGIAETFPFFLLPPAAAGVGAVLLAPQIFPRQEGLALPVAFFAAGWGVVLGADVLWEPPLYTSGPAGLYAIGGAGVLDLVYLSAFLGLIAAWGTHRLLRRGYAPVGGALPSGPANPTRRLREAFALLGDGAPAPSIAASSDAARAAGVQAQRLVGPGPGDAARPWAGLAVPGWVVSDQANLDSVGRAGSTVPQEAARAYVTARALVRLGASLSRPRFASIAQRLGAFAIDLVVLGAGGAAVFVGLVLVTPGGLNGALGSVPFNAAIYGFVAVALLYFALFELAFGATVGKRLLAIEVRDRSLGPVDGLGSFVRNTPLLPVVTLYALGLAVSIAIALRGFPSGATFSAFGLSAGALAIVSLSLVVLAGIGLSGAVGVAVMAMTAERQRLGDLWAGTWVVRRVKAPAIPASVAVPAGPSA